MQLPQKTKRLSTADYAYSQLKKQMIEMELPPSSRIVEERLSEQLNISRTPLRQALYRLELEGLLHKKPNGHMFVAAITLREAREVFRVRERLESLVAGDAAQNITNDVLYELEDIVALMERAASMKRKEELVKRGTEFHDVLYSLSTNETAKRFLAQLHNQIERYRRIGGYKNPDYAPETPLQEHRHILKLLKENKGSEAVEEAMRAHIRRSLVTIEETIRKYLEAQAEISS